VSALKDAIAALLLTEAEFLADLQAIGLQTTGAAAAPAEVLKGFRPIVSIGQEHYPCWLMESGDDQLSQESIGSLCTQYETEILLGLVWHQQDRDTAVDQRDALLPALVRLFLRNPAPAGCGIRVDARGNDRAANHPTHIVTYRLLADVDVLR
jgi:hypothetical protein